MTIDLEGIMTSLNTQRVAVDGVFAAVVASMSFWLELLQGSAHQTAVWVTLFVAVGRAVLFCLDVYARVRSGSKVFTGEHFGQDRTPKP